MKKIFLLSIITVFLILVIYVILSFTQFNQRKNSEKAPVGSFSTKVDIENIPRVSTVAGNLEVPWAIEFLPDGSIIANERPGSVKLISKENIKTIANINAINSGESGLHGLALDPDFSDNNFVYIYYTYASKDANTLNKVSRFTFSNESLENEVTIIDGIPGAPRHDGGRIKFGPDKLLYITTGDATEPSLAQDKNSLAGKILRINKDGTVPKDNPFNNAVYSYGHRNPQGIAWDESGQLYEVEHGNNSTDEFNLIEKGANYGWPTITGNQTRNGMKSPILQSGSSTWAPAGLAYANGKFYFGGLRGNALYEIENLNGNYSLTEYFDGEFGRLREVTKGPNEMLYITTSNKDGRGIPSANDDKIILINPTKISDQQ